MSFSASENVLICFDNVAKQLNLALIASVKMRDCIGNDRETIERECVKLENNFTDVVSQAVYNIKNSSTYKSMYESYSELQEFVKSGFLDNNYRKLNVSEHEQKNANDLIKKWRSTNIVTREHICNTLNTLQEPTYMYLMLYDIIVQPSGQSFELYKYICARFFDLVETHPYLIKYDAIFKNPIACELIQRSYYNFFSSEESIERFKRRNYFLRELIFRQSELLVHTNIDGLDVVDRLKNLRKV